MMTEQEIMNIIKQSLVDRVTAISSAAILISVPKGPDYVKGLQILWDMVKNNIVIQYHINIKSKDASYINVYRWNHI